ncbi:MAG TPA: hypothetical protein VFB75_07725 [Burkholderiales bacterium]|nr:hypothetical protein [Burkholderiales bacterium]
MKITGVKAHLVKQADEDRRFQAVCSTRRRATIDRYAAPARIIDSRAGAIAA